MLRDFNVLAAADGATILIPALVAIAVATISAVLADRIKRRADRHEGAQARLELVAVNFTRADDKLETLSLDITVRNLSATTTCPIQAARFYDIEVWPFPRPMFPSLRRVSHIYDADLGDDFDYVEMHQGVPPGDIDRFAIRLGTSRPVGHGLGSYLYLFRVELILNEPATALPLGRFLVDIRQPVKVYGAHGNSETAVWRQTLVERARELAKLVENDAQVEPRARKVLDNILAASPIESEGSAQQP